MGWPRKNEGARVYFERGPKTYLLVFPDDLLPDGCMEAVGEVLINNDPSCPRLASTAVSPRHIYAKCRRIQWDEMPQVWQDRLSEHLAEPPENYQGLWRYDAKRKRKGAG